MRKQIIFGLSLLMWAHVSATAAECADHTTLGMLDCAKASLTRADDDLNAVYRRLQQRFELGDNGLRLLTKAEESWIAYRDAECDFTTSGSVGGSIRPVVVTSCLERETKIRTQALREFLTCHEGDLSCPSHL
jgi:uncharacterized protein YecT (DUF1311 family)